MDFLDNAKATRAFRRKLYRSGGRPDKPPEFASIPGFPLSPQNEAVEDVWRSSEGLFFNRNERPVDVATGVGALCAALLAQPPFLFHNSTALSSSSIFYQLRFT
jgi:hypothetical protein